MAKKQTRRSISFPRALYNAAAERARMLGIPLAQLACEGLRARGVRVDTEHRPLEDAERAVAGRQRAKEAP